MADQASSLTKTCIVCGQSKPLSAFLELSGPEGTRYGNVCSSCRKTQPDIEVEESTRRQVGGSRIGADELVASEIDKDEQRKKIRREYDEDRKLSADLFNQRSQTIQKKTEFDRRRREGQFGKSLFEEKKPVVKVEEDISFEAEQTREAQINLAAPVEDTRVVKEKRKSSSVWAQFQKWVGAHAPINQQPAAPKVTEQQRKDASTDLTKKETLLDHAEKNLPGTGPSRKR